MLVIVIFFCVICLICCCESVRFVSSILLVPKRLFSRYLLLLAVAEGSIVMSVSLSVCLSVYIYSLKPHD